MSRASLEFKLGSWGLVVTGLLHLVGQVAGRPEPRDASERKLYELAEEVLFELIGARRTLFDVLDGFSLAFAVLLVFAGLTALAISRSPDRRLFRAASIQYTAMSGLLAAISLAHFFAIPTICLALVFLAYFVAVVRSPRPSVA